MDPETVAQYFDSYGWQFERQAPGLYRTGFVGETGHYDIWLRVGSHWVYFTINPYIENPSDGPHNSTTKLLLLRSNHELYMAKFAIDDDEDLVLTVELPMAGFTYSHFADSLTALSHYADAYHARFTEALGLAGGEVV